MNAAIRKHMLMFLIFIIGSCATTDNARMPQKNMTVNQMPVVQLPPNEKKDTPLVIAVKHPVIVLHSDTIQSSAALNVAIKYDAAGGALISQRHEIDSLQAVIWGLNSRLKSVNSELQRERKLREANETVNTYFLKIVKNLPLYIGLLMIITAAICYRLGKLSERKNLNLYYEK